MQALRDFYVARIEKGMWADDGPSHPGTKDRRDHFHLEERREFRPQQFHPASSSSLSGEEGFPSKDSLG